MPDDAKFLSEFFDDVNTKAYQERTRRENEDAQQRAEFHSLLTLYLMWLHGRVRELFDRFSNKLVEHGEVRVIQIAREGESYIELDYPNLARYRIEVDGTTQQLRFGFWNVQGNKFQTNPGTLRLSAKHGEVIPTPPSGHELRGDAAQHAISPFFAKLSEERGLKT